MVAESVASDSHDTNTETNVKYPIGKTVLQKILHLKGRLMDSMVAFDQRYWPTNLIKLQANPADMLRKLAKWPALLGIFIPPTALKNEFKTLLQLLMQKKNFWCNNQNSKPHEFWMLAIKEIPLFPQILKNLIEKLLVIPFGSADAERYQS